LVTAQLQALKAELMGDPLSLGYAPLLVSGNDAALAALLDAAIGPGAALVQQIDITRGALLKGLLPVFERVLGPGIDSNGTAIPVEILAKWRIRFDVLKVADPVIPLDAQIAALLAEAVTDKVATQAQVDGIVKAPGSRAEVLFGAGTVVTHVDVAAARRLP
jgi:hypothetical protein